MPPSLSWSRAEPFGAWVRFGDSLLVAVDHALGASLGVQTGGPGAGALEVSLAITTRCGATCRGCYQEAAPSGEHLPVDVLLARLEAAAAQGASLVAFGGGEPLLHPDVGRLAARARELGLVPVATTNGLVPLGAERLRELSSFAQINVSHDGVQGGYEAVRGFAGAEAAERAMVALRGAGLSVGWNLVLTRGSLHALEASAERARELGCVELQLLRYKPSGRAADAAYRAHALTREEARGLGPRLEALVLRLRGAPSLRIDCSMIPLLAPSLLARGLRGEDLTRAGIFGCEAGRAIGALGVDGRSSPCSFFERDHLIRLAGSAASNLARYQEALPEPCASCALSSACRGGCQVVSRFTRGGLGPDPECLLVADHA